MTSLSDSPAPTRPPAAAGLLARVAAQARFEIAVLLRNGEQLLVSLVLPVLVLLGLVLTSTPTLGAGRRVDLAVPGVLALCVISTSFTGQAIATAYDRRYGVLRLLGVSPLGRSGLLAGKGAAVLVVQVLQLVVVAVTGALAGWRPDLTGVPAAALLWLAGTWAFVAVALLLAGTLRAEGVLAVANLVWVLLLAAGGVIVPLAQLPAAVPAATSVALGLLPSAALGDGLRAALVDGRLAPAPLLVLLAWAAIATALTRWTFRWGD